MTCVKLSILLIPLLTVTTGQGASPRARSADQETVLPGEAGSILRWARSSDGLRFTPTGEVFHGRAAAPALVLRPNGEILALFDVFLDNTADSESALAVSRSRDSGRTWSRPRKIRLEAEAGEVCRARHGAMVSERDGLLRLYFTVAPEARGAGLSARRKEGTALHSAVSRNGLEFRVDEAARLRTSRDRVIRPAALKTRAGVHLFISGQSLPGADASDAVVRRAFAPDGRRFSDLRSTHFQGVDSISSVVGLERGFRAYGSADGAVRSLVSRDGRDWKPESGGCIRNASDPAVLRLRDGSYLMLYCSSRDPAGKNTPTPMLDNADESLMLLEGPEDEMALGAEWDESVAFGDLAVDTTLEVGAAEPTDQDSVIDFAVDEMFADLADDWPNEEAWEFSRSETAPTSSPLTLHSSDGFAPRPNLDDPIDYFEWYRENALDQPADNAYEAYAEFMPGFGEAPDWPPLSNMFNDDRYAGPPAPWDPAERAEWEQSHQAAQDLLAQFREATRHEGYAHPAQVADGPAGEVDGEPLLLGMLLPHLGPHRQLAKATVADAWRMEGGKVSPTRMLDAWETTLRGAEHLSRGATLIEDLVGVAERGLVQENARWALAHDVFSTENELQTALDLLGEYDQDRSDPGRGLLGEQAFAMDITQFIFSPPDAAGRERRLTKLAEAEALGESFLGSEKFDHMMRMSRDDARTTLDAFDDYYRETAGQMRTGYPQVRAADLDATAEKYLHTSPLTETFLPALSRVHTLRARSETSRRATQLSYAVHLFKAREGRWPVSLDELPDQSQRMRTDPFTGGDFGYRLGEDGPTIYSLSENGRDDRGVHSQRWGDGAEDPDGSDDHVFWPPQPK